MPPQPLLSLSRPWTGRCGIDGNFHFWLDVDRFIYTFSFERAMFPVRRWVILNVTLGIIALFLGLYLAGISPPVVGKALSALDRSLPLCLVEWKDEFTPWDNLDQCCLQARKQLSCENEDLTIDGQRLAKVCTTGKTSVKFHLNQKAYSYCRSQVIW